MTRLLFAAVLALALAPWVAGAAHSIVGARLGARRTRHVYAAGVRAGTWRVVGVAVLVVMLMTGGT